MTARPTTNETAEPLVEARPMFEFELPTDELWAERTGQFIGCGIPREIIRQVKGRVSDSWIDGPGGWTYEWMAVAEDLGRRGRWLQAALAYGAARFPSLASPARVEAHECQQQAFAKATAGSVERQVIDVPYRSGSVAVPVHRYRSRRPATTICLTGGVDTWKVELHRVARALRALGRFDLVVFDMPGTGDSDIPLSSDADQIYAGVVEAVRDNDRPVGVMGMSFGGLWAAKLAMTGGVDFAIDLGGPVQAAPRSPDDVLSLPNGMPGIVAHALWLDALPLAEQVPTLLEPFSLAERFAQERPHLAEPLLVVNGTEDQYLPPSDVEVFRRYPEATVWPVAGTSHCAVERIVPVMLGIMAWARQQSRRSLVDRGLTNVIARAL